MRKKKYSETEREINAVLLSHSKRLTEIEIKRQLGHSTRTTPSGDKPSVLHLRTWNEISHEAIEDIGTEADILSLFSESELEENKKYVLQLSREFNTLHRLDDIDIAISACAGLLSAAIDILLVGVPHRGKEGLEAKPLSDWIRARFEEAFPVDKMDELARNPIRKVPYDAQDNRNTTEYITGLSAYYHRLLSLGHDPLLGFVVGVFDIISGRMTTIDKNGVFVSQVMENYTDRTEQNIFLGIAKQFRHLSSDVTTSMGLPAPLMGLFNLLQFGSIGEYEQTIAEIVQGMYYEGYDFIHFCSLSVPAMLTEVFVRVCYCLKRVKEGFSLKESIPLSVNREKHPKLGTMLFISRSIEVAANAEKIYFLKNPMAVNYTQWIAFAHYSYAQLKWVLRDKPEMRSAYINSALDEELADLVAKIDSSFENARQNSILVIDS